MLSDAASDVETNLPKYSDTRFVVYWMQVTLSDRLRCAGGLHKVACKCLKEKIVPIRHKYMQNKFLDLRAIERCVAQLTAQRES